MPEVAQERGLRQQIQERRDSKAQQAERYRSLLASEEAGVRALDRILERLSPEAERDIATLLETGVLMEEPPF